MHSCSTLPQRCMYLMEGHDVWDGGDNKLHDSASLQCGALEQWLAKCGPWTSIHITCEFVRNEILRPHLGSVESGTGEHPPVFSQAPQEMLMPSKV